MTARRLAGPAVGAAVAFLMLAVMPLGGTGRAYADGGIIGWGAKFTDWCANGSVTDIAPALLAAPPSLAGSMGSSGVTVAAGAATDVTLPAVVAFAAGYCGGTKLLHWFWPSSHVVEQEHVDVSSGSTAYGGGCWDILFGQSGAPCTPTYPPSGTPYRADSYTGNGTTLTYVAGPSLGTYGDIVLAYSWTAGAFTGATTRFGLSCSGRIWNSDVDTSAASGSLTVTLPGDAWCRSQGYAPTGFFVRSPGSTYYSSYAGEYVMQGASTWSSTPAPDHKLRFEVVCKDAAGGVTTHTAYSATFKEGDATLPPLELQPCPTGEVPQQRTVSEGDANGLGGPTLVDWTVGNPDATLYGDCLPGGVSAPCQVTLWKINPDTGGKTLCSAPGVDCTATTRRRATRAPSTNVGGAPTAFRSPTARPSIRPPPPRTRRRGCLVAARTLATRAALVPSGRGTPGRGCTSR